MSTPERPLHVQVAEALGWEKCARTGAVQYYDRDIRIDNREWTGVDPVVVDRSYRRVVFRYDLDWSVTGPLVEKYAIKLRKCNLGWHAGVSGATNEKSGDTPLLAICALILTLAKEGKL